MSPDERPARSVPAGDFDYEAAGHGYARRRRTDPRIAARVVAALGGARTVINVGAGAGSYEPADRYVIAIEPSATMRAQRPSDRVPAIDAVAERLPFDDDSFDAGTALFTIHQWRDLDAGLRELRRVTRGPVVILTFADNTLLDFWLIDYVPDVLAREAPRMPALERVAALLGGEVTVEPVPIPSDCADGFIEAYYGRPEAFLDPSVRAAQSAWGLADPVAVERGLDALRADLESGAWDARYGSLRTRNSYLGSLRLVVAR
jgi:SAM-dependent methyltransferase